MGLAFIVNILLIFYNRANSLFFLKKVGENNYENHISRILLSLCAHLRAYILSVVGLRYYTLHVNHVGALFDIIGITMH